MTATLLTVDELKGYIQDTAESNETLQQRLDDTEAEINARFGRLEIGSGDADEVTERIEIRRYMRALSLSQNADEISEIMTTANGIPAEDPLDPTSYRIRGGYELVLVAGGAWAYDYVDVTYRPADARAKRRRGLVKLIQLDMSYVPGMGSQGAGGWSESYFGKTYEGSREEIMRTIGDVDDFA